MTQQLAKGVANVCILAGYESQDYKGAQIMKDLRKQYGDDVNFYGIGGPLMEAEGLKENVGDVNLFLDKPFYPWKNNQWNLMHVKWYPPLLNVVSHNEKVFKQVSWMSFDFAENYLILVF